MARAYLSSFLVAHVQEANASAATDVLEWPVSPELLMRKDSSLNQEMITTPESDVFAFGAIVMEVGLPP